MNPEAISEIKSVLDFQPHFRNYRDAAMVYFRDISGSELIGTSFVEDAGIVVPADYLYMQTTPSVAYVANIISKDDFLEIDSIDKIKKHFGSHGTLSIDSLFNEGYRAVSIDTRAVLNYINNSAINERIIIKRFFVRGRIGELLAKMLEIAETRNIFPKVYTVISANRLANVSVVKNTGGDIRAISMTDKYSKKSKK